MSGFDSCFLSGSATANLASATNDQSDSYGVCDGAGGDGEDRTEVAATAASGGGVRFESTLVVQGMVACTTPSHRDSSLVSPLLDLQLFTAPSGTGCRPFRSSRPLRRLAHHDTTFALLDLRLVAGSNNPRNATLLTVEQKRLAIGLLFGSGNTFVATLEVGGCKNADKSFPLLGTRVGCSRPSVSAHPPLLPASTRSQFVSWCHMGLQPTCPR